MANILIYDEQTTRALRYMKSVHTPDYDGRTDILVNPNVTGINLEHARVDGSVVRNGTLEEINTDISSYNLEHYAELRQRSYPPLGEQLDAILKQMNYDRMQNNKELIQEMDNIIGQWLQVKEDYPKPAVEPIK